jgi:outer membrane receptor protein involved in Fe transport
MRLSFIISVLFLSTMVFGQNKISGVVIDIKGDPIPGARIQLVDNTTVYSYADFTGAFSLKTNANFPMSISVSMLGYTSSIVPVTAEDKEALKVTLQEEAIDLNELVISASRTAEKLIESPVTIEKMSLKEIKNTTSATFYDGLENLKELHLNTGSFANKSINTRGFATAANPRFMQLVDGMENTAPSLNVVIGNLVGVSDLDIENVEVLPGASSALYGANAFNGIMFLNSISPFKKQGISTYIKTGQTNQKAAGSNTYFDFGIRGAVKFSEKFAIKGNFNYLKANDWIANDARNIAPIGQNLSPNQFYDGLNLYGDEIFKRISTIGFVSRTPYRDQDLNDNKVENLKVDASLHYKPLANDFEIILQHKMGFGSTAYSASDARTQLKDFLLRQTKLEIKGKNYFVRTYLTGQDSGDSYSMTRTAWNINALAKSDKEWFKNFEDAYNAARPTFGTDYDKLAIVARNYADNNIKDPSIAGLPILTGTPRFVVGTSQYKEAFDKVTSSSDTKLGSKFTDKSSFLHAEGNYNFKDLINFAEIQIGGSYRKYDLNSKGTVFTDLDSKISFSEFGVYSQIQKKFLDERLKFTGSVRYDKSKNFNGNFSPRISMSYSFGDNKQRNFRASYQTGFRNPTTQDQYNGINIGAIALVGSAPDNLARFTETVEVSTKGQQPQSAGNPTGASQPATITLTGYDTYQRAYSYTSVQEFALTGDATKLKAANTSIVKPERVKSYEIGYRADISKFLIDFNAYYNVYNDIITQKKVVTPYYGAIGSQLSIFALANTDVRTYQVYTNSDIEVSSLGIGIGLTKKIFDNYDIGFSYNYAEASYNKTTDPDFAPSFNTPKQRFKANFGNDKLFKNFGFNTNVRWNSSYQWQSTFASGEIPTNFVFDAQINYAIPVVKSVFKLGGTNLFGKDYLQVLGAGLVGQQYYLSLTFNP